MLHGVKRLTGGVYATSGRMENPVADAHRHGVLPPLPRG